MIMFEFYVAFNSEGTLLASGSADNTIKLWIEDGSSYSEQSKISVNSVAFNSEGTLLASGSADNTIKLNDLTRKNTIINL